MSSNSLYPTCSITKPTRITSNSATLIDNIFTNSKSYQTSGIIITDISDHLPVFITTDLKLHRNNIDTPETEVRQFNAENMKCFKSELGKVDWENLCSEGDANKSYKCFIDKFNSLYDKCFLKSKKVLSKRVNKIKSPWLSYGLLKCIRRKNRLYKKFLRKPTEINMETYKKYRNRLNFTLKLAKRNYFTNLLEKEKNNMRNTWKVLNSIIRPKNYKKCSEKFVSNNEIYTCPDQIATKFNQYFANIGPELASSIQHAGRDFSSYLKNSSTTTCFFTPTNEDEIAKIISKLGNRKSAGHDNVKSDLIKQVTHEIAYPLSIVFNKSLSQGIVPDDFKIAKVVPKKDNPKIFGNYRPVSVLPCLSKILERLVYKRTYEFLSKNNILYKKQYGFRTNHSTYMAVIDFIKDVSEAIDEGMNTIGIFMDLSKAFDTIDHDILLTKLYHYGFRGISYEWFRNYLTNRKQYVSYNTGKSQYENIQCGVPQGSILGPLLFIVYMNDICCTSNLLKTILFADDTTCFYSHKDIDMLCEIVNNELREVCNWFKANKPQGSILGPLLFIVYMNDICCTSNLLKTILFADDTTCFYSHKDIDMLCEIVNNELREVCNWFKANKLSLNAKKTNLMFLGTRFQTKQIDDKYIVCLDGCKLTRVGEAKFLGIVIDENLTWNKQIDNVLKSCARNIGVLNKLKHFLPEQALYRLYCSLVLPYLNYGLLLWGNANKTSLGKVYKLQKRALRIISNSHYLSSSKPLFEKYNVLNIFDMYKKETGIFMYKYRNNMLPQSFDGIFTNHQSNHNYDTRNKGDYQLSMQRVNTIVNTGPKLWNELPKYVKSSKTLGLFKKNISRVFLSAN